jgi:diguanylate cyclase (GGDEF)-like protein
MSDEEAVQILLDRRGTMYDPLIVDTFIRLHSITPRQEALKSRAHEVLDTIAHSRRPHRAETIVNTDEHTESANEMLSVYGLTAALAGHASIGDACDVIAKHLRRLIPAATCVFFIYDSRTDELKAEHVFGEGSSSISGLAIGVGQRLSGWVAANRHTICNSDAVLDLEELAWQPVRLRTCISTPLVSNDELIGVLSLYGSEHSFNEDHRRIIEVIASQIAHTFRRTIQLSASLRRDSLTGLPHAEQFDSLIASIAETDSLYQQHALLFIEIANLRYINGQYGRAVGDEVLRHVVRLARNELRIADILFRNSGDDFVAFLGATDRHTARLIAARIEESIGRNQLVVNGDITVVVEATVTAVATPYDGCGVRDLMTKATQRRSMRRLALDGPSIH